MNSSTAISACARMDFKVLGAISSVARHDDMKVHLRRVTEIGVTSGLMMNVESGSLKNPQQSSCVEPGQFRHGDVLPRSTLQGKANTWKRILPLPVSM